MSNQRTYRGPETLKHLNPVIWQTDFVLNDARRTKGFREAVFRDHILLNYHLSSCQFWNSEMFHPRCVYKW